VLTSCIIENNEIFVLGIKWILGSK